MCHFVYFRYMLNMCRKIETYTSFDRNVALHIFTTVYEGWLAYAIQHNIDTATFHRVLNKLNNARPKGML